jgi:hypothetical protein
MNKENRIYFTGSPYPNGHLIKEFKWSGRIDNDDQLWFDFHLKTEDYDTDNNHLPSADEETASNWHSKVVWNNYNSCILSSTYWGDHQGILLDTTNVPFSFQELISKGLVADKLPLEDDDYDNLAFSIYLLGHDSCAGHRFVFSKTTDGMDLEWSGKIALTYAGENEFNHDFKIVVQNVIFDGFHYPKEWSQEEALEAFDNKIASLESYEFVDMNPKSFQRNYKLVPKKL